MAPKREDVGRVIERASPRTCSGDMYPTVPSTVPGSVPSTAGGRVGAEASRVTHLGQAEVEDLDASVVGQKDVVGLQVAVDDPLSWAAASPWAIGLCELHRLAPGDAPSTSPSCSVSSLQELR